METRAKIIKGAAELFTKYGVRSVTMDDIARELSISKKTIYQYFKDKDEIVLMAVQSHAENEKEDYNYIFNRSRNPIEELTLMTRCMRDDFRDMNPSLIFDLQKYHPQAWKVIEDFKNSYIKNALVRNLRDGIEQGLYRENMDPEVLAIMRLEQVQLAFDSRLFPPDKFNLADTQLQFLSHYVNGIVTEKGRELYLEYLNKLELHQTKTTYNNEI